MTHTTSRAANDCGDNNVFSSTFSTISDNVARRITLALPDYLASVCDQPASVTYVNARICFGLPRSSLDSYNLNVDRNDA